MFILSESEVAAELGVHRRVVRTVRADLVQGVHWQIEKNAIGYSQDGLAEIKRLLGVLSAGPDALTPPESVQSDFTKKTAVVVSTCRNPKILMAEVDGNLSRVKVRDNRNFIPGMDLEVEHIESDLWAYTGRLPRGRGRL